MIYLDTSAALKLVVAEPETARLELWLAAHAGSPRVSSRLLRIEMLRAVTRTAAYRMSRVNVALRAIALLNMDDVAPAAEVIGGKALRSLDVIHLATAHEIRTELTAFVCYDKRLRDSSHALAGPPSASRSSRLCSTSRTLIPTGTGRCWRGQAFRFPTRRRRLHLPPQLAIGVTQW